jgi:hypothetical protein
MMNKIWSHIYTFHCSSQIAGLSSKIISLLPKEIPYLILLVRTWWEEIILDIVLKYLFLPYSCFSPEYEILG